MTQVKWRFPASNYGESKGISSGDTETFKKDPYQSFAREILQNSIDVKVENGKPVKIVFNEFTIKTKDIPGIEEYKEAVKRCIEFWSSKKDYVKEYEKKLELLENEEIDCLRISDFNTQGLRGIDSTSQENNFFLAFVKGTGVSIKNGPTSGGSKGLGKNVSFILSKLGMVYYSTRTNDTNSIGSIGVADLISGYVEGDNSSENKDHTQGKGYYGIDDKNNPLKCMLNLENDYERGNETGTDIYIIGFKNSENWVNEVVNGILESFMVAIVKNSLVVQINDMIIDKYSVLKIIESDIVSKKNISSIMSQYLLMMGGEDIIVKELNTEYGTLEVYLKVFDKNEKDYSTHSCSMVRYPYMKIKDFEYQKSYNVSALCIIPNTELGQKLRNIENAKHVEWEFKRIEDKSERVELRNVVNSIRDQINDFIQEALQLDMNDTTDVEGAGDFLPSVEEGMNKSKNSCGIDNSDKVTIGRLVENIMSEKNAYLDDDKGTGLGPEVGALSEEGDDVEYPTGENQGNGNAPHRGSEVGGKDSGDDVVYVKKSLAGVRYKVISTDRRKGELKIIFISPIDSKKCSLSISLVDDANGKNIVDIVSAKINGKTINGNNPKDYGPFSIKRNEKIILEVITNQTEYFASEVKVYASEE